MRSRSLAEQRIPLSCNFPTMPALTPHCFCNTSSALIQQQEQQSTMLSKTHVRSPSFKLRELSQIPRKTLSLEVICQRGSLRQGFDSFSSFFADHNSNSFDEAYAPILELCATRKALLQGQQIQAHLIKYIALSDSVFLSTKLVFMYGKCGAVYDAEKVFTRMRERTIFTWNAMMGAYVSNGESLGALELYREMRVLGIPLDSCTFPTVLKACGTVGDIRCGAEIHSLVIKCGYETFSFVANSLVSMYAKCNDVNKARKLFDRMIEKNDVVSWNSIISAYSANGRCLEALELFREMQRAGVAPNSYTFVAALQACEDDSYRKLGLEIHAATLKISQFLDVYVANALVSMYARLGEIGEAVGIFGKLGEKDTITWNSLLAGCVQNFHYNEALQFFHDFCDAGFKPDQVSITSILAACGRLGHLLNGKEIHAYAIKNGFDSNIQVGNTLIDMYAKCCCISYTGRAFDMMSDKDFISWTTVIASYAQNNHHIGALKMLRQVQMEGMHVDSMMIGSILLACRGLKCLSLVKEVHGYILRQGLSDLVLQNTILDAYGVCESMDCAKRMFGSIDSKDVVSWTGMISSYVHNGLAKEALEIFSSMTETGIEPDSISLVSVLSAAASLSVSKNGKEMHSFVIRKGFMLEGSIANSLVDMYARCGNLETAYKIFICTSSKSLVLWTTMINAYGMHGCGKEAVELFIRMEDQKQIPDHVTFLALLYACSHSGLTDEGKTVLEIMKCKYQLEPWPEHYACVVDLLGRGNRLEEAYQFVKSMQIEPSAEVWCALLGACRVHLNKEIGEIAVQKLLELDPENPGNHVLISNVFAASGKWKDVEAVRRRMKGSGLKKNPGCSWIEVGSKIHTFLARDKSHPESDKIYNKLAQITERLEREGGYVAQTKFVLHNVGDEEKLQMLYGHSERLAIAYGLLGTREGTPIRITKNLRVCGDCHTFCKLVSKFFERELVVRDASRFHHFEGGLCSCGDFW